MNTYAVIILIALLAEAVVGFVAEVLNLRALRRPLPPEFEGVYDAEAYRRSQAYTRARTRLGLITSAVSLSALLAFWFLGGFNALDQVLRGFDLGPVLIGVLYIGNLLLARSLLSLPFSLYNTFVLEERFGFNKTTLATFVADRVKALALSIVIGGPLLAGLLAFFTYGGPWAWLYAWLSVTAVMLIFQFVAPTWIMPLFNKFTPLEDGELRQAVFAYAESVSFPLKNVYVMDGSKRSSKSNAFFTGFGKNKRIALFDTLIEQHTVAELVAVLAHEIGHYKKKHILKNLAVGILHMGVLFLILSFVLRSQGLFDAFYMEASSVYAGLVFFGLLYTPVEFILSLFLQALSRKHEFEADAYAADTTGRSTPMVEALKKLSVHNLSNLTPHPLYVLLNYSHPPVLERIRSLEARTAALSRASWNPSL